MMNQVSLVKYNTPTLVSTTGDKKNKKKGAPVVEKKTTQTEDILNSILPPREWTEDGQLWVQYVSSTPATRLEVINLQEQLDNQLQQRQARETGICPIREELYSQCFDELIRQITINCAERGLLLLRVRDEAKMRISSYETLYESSIAYGIRKALMAEQKKLEYETKINNLKLSKKDLEVQVENLKKTIEITQQRSLEKRQSEMKAHADEIERSQKMNEQLKTNLETMLSAPKK
mmetsp:Transcript_234/g.217  ORF Transcript_234/g.217 Transcript_234/m.217 type:complete len:234 (-) Transcript_234:230-931(-)